MQFSFHSLESAPQDAIENLESAEKSLGFIPNLYAGLATAPQALKAYLSLGDYFSKTSFSPTEQQVILLSVSVENSCTYCVAAHSVIAKQMLKVEENIVNSIRQQGPLTDPKLEALAQFTRTVVKDRGFVSDYELEQFLAAGYNKQQILEVVLGVTMKTLSNYANHVLQTKTDAAFSKESWNKE